MRRLAIALSLFAATGCKEKEEGAVPATARQSEQAPAPLPAGKAADAAPDLVLDAHIADDSDVSGLALTIDAVYEHEKPLDKPPWHGAGGDWRFLDLRTPGGARFTVGMGDHKVAKPDVPFVLYEAMLIGGERAQGEAVVNELAKGLGTSPPTRSKKARPLLPTRLTAVELARNVARSTDGGFSGAGTWTASKWTFETDDDEAEIYFNHSLADKRAELMTKDEEYNKGIAAVFAAALRDGQRER